MGSHKIVSAAGYEALEMAAKRRRPYDKGRGESCEWWGACTKLPHGRAIMTCNMTDTSS